MCVLTTHIGFHCIRCVVIVLHLSSWSDDPHILLSSFNPYLSDPLTLLFAYPSFSRSCLPFVLPFSRHHCCITNTTKLSHSLITVTHHTSHTLGTIYADSVAGCSSALLSREILYPSQVSVPVKDKLEFLGRSLANIRSPPAQTLCFSSVTTPVYPV